MLRILIHTVPNNRSLLGGHSASPASLWLVNILHALACISLSFLSTVRVRRGTGPYPFLWFILLEMLPKSARGPALKNRKLSLEKKGAYDNCLSPSSGSSPWGRAPPKGVTNAYKDIPLSESEENHFMRIISLLQTLCCWGKDFIMATFLSVYNTFNFLLLILMYDKQYPS